ncbi:putative sodium/proton antiporter domain protein [Rhodococcus sp. MTM3W5.2]|nr:putative sodium/proton antiporter domain protein [Rhodococcus sp. MTM3W5.2]
MSVTWLFLVVIVAMAVTGFAKRFDLQVPWCSSPSEAPPRSSPDFLASSSRRS